MCSGSCRTPRAGDLAIRRELRELDRAVGDLSRWSDVHVVNHSETNALIADLAQSVLRLRAQVERLERKIGGGRAAA